MQPVQDLTVEDRVSRTQYQYSLEDPDAKELATWAPQVRREAARRCRSCATWPAISRTTGCRRELVIDRDTASRLGITPQMIDDTLYDAFGQRQVSTMFTQLNQYRVVLEVKPEFQQRAAATLSNIYVRSPTGGAGAAQRVHAHRASDDAAGDQPPGPVPGGDALVQPRARRRRWATRSRRSTRRKARSGHAAEHRRRVSRARPQAFQASLANEPLLILAALVTVYIVLGVLYESYIHPITILSTLPSAGVGALLALLICRHRSERHRADRHHPADRHREEERDHDDRLRARSRAQRGQVAGRGDLSRPACCASGRS